MDFFQLATAQPARLQFKVDPFLGKAQCTSPYKINPNSIGNGRGKFATNRSIKAKTSSTIIAATTPRGTAFLQVFFWGGESHNLLKSLACPTGIEPVTLSLEG